MESAEPSHLGHAATPQSLPESWALFVKAMAFYPASNRRVQENAIALTKTPPGIATACA